MSDEKIKVQIDELESQIFREHTMYFDDYDLSIFTEFESIYLRRDLFDYVNAKLELIDDDSIKTQGKNSRINTRQFAKIELLLDKALLRTELDISDCDVSTKAFLAFYKVRKIICPNCGAIAKPVSRIHSFIHYRGHKHFCDDVCRAAHHSISKKSLMLQNYGVRTNAALKHVIDKRTATNIERYGVSNPMKLKRINARASRTRQSNDILLNRNKFERTSKSSMNFFDEHIVKLFENYECFYGESERRFQVPENYDEHLQYNSVLYDFYCPLLNIIIEFHGAYWHRNTQDKDAAKERLAKEHYKILNYFVIWDNEVNEKAKVEKLISSIKSIIQTHEQRKT